MTEETKKYNLSEAFVALNEKTSKNFKESLDISINLGIDASKSDQNVRNVVGKREMSLSAARAQKDHTLHISSIVKVRE